MLKEKLNGLKLELLDDTIVEELSFNEDSISATLGVENGPLTAPILKFKVSSNDSIIIKGLFPIIWKNIEFSESHIKVVRNGEPAVYKIKATNTKNQKRKLP